MIRVEKEEAYRIRQGNIYRDIGFTEYALEDDGVVEISNIIFPLIIVLTQDCDLQQDYDFRYSEPRKDTQDKYLLSLLVAPLYNVEHFYNGEP